MGWTSRVPGTDLEQSKELVGWRTSAAVRQQPLLDVAKATSQTRIASNGGIDELCKLGVDWFSIAESRASLVGIG